MELVTSVLGSLLADVDLRNNVEMEGELVTTIEATEWLKEVEGLSMRQLEKGFKEVKRLEEEGISLLAANRIPKSKTTLIKNLNNKLRNASSAQPFSIVIWVTVSQELDLIKIQTQIAERLDLGLIMNGSNRTVAGRGGSHIKAHQTISSRSGWRMWWVTLGNNHHGNIYEGKTRVELWKDALNELRRSVPYNIEGIEDKVYKPLKWSYDSLQGESIKSCFLYCSLFPEDFSIQISELVQCWLAEGFINEQQNYEDVKNRGIALIENLKDCCLLEHGDHKDTVKMHDVVRDVAKWIASTLEDGSKSLVESGVGLAKFQRVFRASTLLLQGNLPLQEVPEGFLLGFQALRVLNMSGTQIQRLPSSILQLAQLRALLLKGAFVWDGAIEEVKGAKPITHYPLKTVQAEVIAGLSSLEVLDMTDSEYKWCEGKGGRGRASFEELECLEKLIDLSIRLESTSCPALEDVNWMNKLNRFLFHMGSTTHEIHKETEHDGRQQVTANRRICARRDLLPNLEEIHLCGLTRLVTISELTSQLDKILKAKSNGSDLVSQTKIPSSYGGFIRTLKIWKKSKLTSLFREESLPQLEKLVVTECSLLKKLPLTSKAQVP
ncbi:Disease resistance protein [Vitis vinifera]|uniref:Disease resistance protein n=1 Tax=Vitis vinifera TaxID=29760 RepID=A0A438H4M2_VITVI|nr:Disease resistance protein [Vitis vinifera]